MAELESTYKRFQEQIDEVHHPIYHYGKEMILEQLLGGPEVQLEIMLKDGQVRAPSSMSPSRGLRLRLRLAQFMQQCLSLLREIFRATSSANLIYDVIVFGTCASSRCTTYV
jgi:hypothetical protein